MKTIITVVLCLFCGSVLLAQPPTPFSPDSNTVGLWHFDEASGTLIQDASFFHNDAHAIGTTIVPGRFGNARYFNGAGDYAYVPDPINGSLDFGVEESFTVEAWFKTTSFAEQRIVRKGLAPIQGYELGLAQGRVFGIIGNREDGTPPDTLLRVISDATYNDNVWHHAVLIRDRPVSKLFLYVDGTLAGTPVNDNISFPLANDLPLGIGRWYGSIMPLYFQGTIDEVRISNITRYPGFVVADTVGLWHLDEATGSTLFDSSPLHNNGVAYGASVVGGVAGNARYFNGTSSYATIPTNASYNFQSSESFTVSVWVKTNEPEGIIVRRGLDPIPGFQLSIHFGRAIGRIGNTRGNSWSDTLLTLTSAQLINDNVWHEIRMVRDRTLGKLFLYVDGLSAATPQDDNFLIPLTNDRPLTLGASLILPDYFTGPIDEVSIFRGARHPVTTTSDTVALWHCDEPTGSSVIDSSPYHNDGFAIGTTIVPGRFGNARSFNGMGDYVRIPNPMNGIYNFSSSQSFTIRAWVKTTGTEGIILRRGLVPYPGFQLSIHFGRAIGIIGNHQGSSWNDTLLMMTSVQPINDSTWHEITMVRDRSQARLFLYVDGVPAATPQSDNFTIPLTNDRPLTFGAWEIQQNYFTGGIDEIAIFRGAHHPEGFRLPDIDVAPVELNFGPVLVGGSMTQALEISNHGGGDALVITGILSSSPVFGSDTDSLVVSSGQTRVIHVSYTPSAVASDTGSLSIASNDPDEPVVQVRLTGRGYQAGAAPVITRVADVPGDQGKQVRVIWYRSMFDAPGDSIHIATYGVWRRVDDPGPVAPPQGIAPGTIFSVNGHTLMVSANELWDFVATIPAVQFEQYAFVAPTLYDSTHINGMHWSVFRVSAHALEGMFFFSDPDSGYSADNIPPSPPFNLNGSFTGGSVFLTWDVPPDPDLSHYMVHRSTVQNFIPDATTTIGSPRVNSYVDTSPGGSPAVYYRVVSLDSAGNQSTFSDVASVLLTGTGGSDFVPEVFALHQNYPNPFNPETIISYDVPVASHVTLSIFDVNGREVQRLVNGFEQPGRYFVTWTPRTFASGVYLCRMIAGRTTFTRKMVILK